MKNKKFWNKLKKEEIEILDFEPLENKKNIKKKIKLKNVFNSVFFNRFNNKREEIEILDFDETKKDYKKILKYKLLELRKIIKEFKLVSKLKFGVFCFLLVFVFVTTIFMFKEDNFLVTGAKKFLSGLGIYTEEVKNLTIVSDDSGVSGTWNIDKSVNWIGNDTVEVIYDVDSAVKSNNNGKDIIFVLDVSESMIGAKFDKVKKDLKELIEHLVLDANNKVSIITFSNTSTVESIFSNDKEALLEIIDTMTASGETNYYAALKNVDVVMTDYVKQNNRDVVTLFLTDGYPNVDSPNQEGMFYVLKEKYPYMKINGVQFEMGNLIIDEIKEITDAQWSADEISLNNILFEAAVEPKPYEKFEISDYIDNNYFTVESIEDISTTKGKVTIQENAGSQQVVWDLDEEDYLTGENVKMTVNLKLKEEYVTNEGFYPVNEKDVVNYKLYGEEEVEAQNDKKLVLKNKYKVTYDTNTPSGCSISNPASEEYFVYQNVEKNNQILTCDGYLFKGWEIADYDGNEVQVVNDDTFIMPNHDVVIRGTWTKHSIRKSVDGKVFERATLFKVLKSAAENHRGATEYTGSELINNKCGVYHYNSGDVNNNVIFGDFCWKMIRTTETCGVKMIYNGKPSENGTCSNTGIDAEIEGTSTFNTKANSLGYVGYMYGDNVYPTVEYNPSGTETISPSIYISETVYYGDSVTYDGSLYSLNNIASTSDKSNLIGKYTFLSNSADSSYNYVYYIVNVSYNYVYYVKLLLGEKVDVPYLFYGDEYVYDEQTNMFYLTNSQSISKVEWINKYSDLIGKYVCYGENQYCDNILLVSSSSTKYKFNYSIVSPSSYGKSFTYDSTTGEYTLVDKKSFELTSLESYDELNNYHYTCFNSTGICDKIKYVFYINDGVPIYLEISGGESIGDVIDSMLYADDVNTNDSALKITIEKWFEDNFLDYEKYLEDTVYCNDRSVSELNGWNPNGGDLTKFLRFYSYSNFDLKCENPNDRFTKYVENGNGKLKYPVGFLTAGEAYLVGKDVVAIDDCYWLGSPYYYSTYHAINYNIYKEGLLNGYRVNGGYGVRPVISLVPNMEFYKGNGSEETPYVLDLTASSQE